MIFEVFVFVFFSLIFGALFYYISLVNQEKKTYANIPGPEQNGIIDFLIGDVKRFKNHVGKGRPYAELIYEDFRRFNSKTIKYRLLNHTIILSQDPRVIKEVLIDQKCDKDKRIYKKFGFPFSERLSGHGLFGEVNFDEWKKQRILFNPVFHKNVLKSFMREFNSKVDILMQHLKKIAENENKDSISLLELLNRTALDIIASVAFNMDVDSINNPNDKLYAKIPEALQGVQNHILDPLFAYNPFKFKEISKFRNIVRDIRQIGREEIKKRLKCVKNDENVPDDILTVILNSYAFDALKIEDMIDQFVTFFIAGQETSANTLASAFLEIGKHSEVLEKLKHEIDSEIGSKTLIEYEDLNKLKYTSCVFKEAMRLHPTAPGVARVTAEDIKIDNIVIPKGSTIDLSIYSCGHNEEYFPEPFSFKPERFLPENAASIQNYTYFPFSLGPRNCIGQNFAQIEAKIVIAKFIQNFDLKLDPDQSFEMSQSISLKPKDGTRAFITLRH